MTQINKEKTLDKDFQEILETKKYRKLATIYLGIFFGGFVLWSALVPLYEGVPTIAKVVVDTKRKAVQHSTGGVLKKIFVREGDFVEKDQLLIKLGDAKAQSEVLIEENNIRSIKENINLQYTSLKKIEGLIVSSKKQLALVEEELNGIKDLVEEGYAPKISQIDLEKEFNEINSKQDELKGTKKQTSQAISEMEFKLSAARERLEIAKRALAEKEITASVAGQVVGLNKQAVGEVIQPAEKIMDLVPGDEQLLIEAEIMPNLIDRVEIGDEVDIRFTTFSLSPFLVVSGRVVSLSTDVLANTKTGMPYYLARIRVTKEGFEKLGKRKMRPGMEVGVIVKTGSRTLLTYILHPLTRRISSSLKEE